MTVLPFPALTKPDKAAAERDELIRQARAIYESIFPSAPALAKPPKATKS